MKKLSTVLISVALACFVLFSAVSCTREYTCQCKMTFSGKPGLPEPKTRSYSIRDTKDHAKTLCEGNSATYDKNGVKTVEDCHLW